MYTKQSFNIHLTMKKIILKNDNNIKDDLLFQKITFIANVFFNGFSPIESQIMGEIIKLAENNTINITTDISKSIRNTLNLTANTLNVSLGRIEKKGAIRRLNKVIVFQPIWNGILQENEYLITFQHRL